MVSSTESRGVTELASRFEALAAAKPKRRESDQMERARALILRLAMNRLESSLSENSQLQEGLRELAENSLGDWNELVGDLLAAASHRAPFLENAHV